MSITHHNSLCLHIPVQMEGCYFCIVSVITSIWFPFYHIVSVIPTEQMGSTEVPRITSILEMPAQQKLEQTWFCSIDSSVNPENNWFNTPLADRVKMMQKRKTSQSTSAIILWMKCRGCYFSPSKGFSM